MRQRGRISANSLLVPPVLDGDGRAMPPAELDEDAAAVWTQITQALPADWFPPELLPLLTSLCGDISTSKRVSAELARLNSLKSDEAFKRFASLARLKVALSGSIANLSTRLQLTNQSRLTAKRASAFAETARHPRPWDILGDRANPKLDALNSDDRADEREPVDWTPGRQRLKN